MKKFPIKKTSAAWRNNQKDHSSLPPSGAYSWLECKGKYELIQLNRHRIADESSEYADTGTRAHELIADALMCGVEIEDVLTSKDHLSTYKCCQEYIDICYELIGISAYSPLIEEMVPLYYNPTESGTVDFASFNDNTLSIVDYKHGVQNVSPEYNTQLGIYARSIYERMLKADKNKVESIDLIVVQPNSLNYTGRLNGFSIELDKFIEWTDSIGIVANEILNEKDLPLKASKEICKWCKAEGFCPEKHKKAFEVLAPKSKPLGLINASSLPSVSSMSIEQVTNVVKAQKEIVSWMKACEKQLGAETSLGNETGYKWVETSGNRKWKDNEAAEAAMTKSGVWPNAPAKIITPTQYEKECKKLGVEYDKDLITRPKGRALVPLEDERKAINQINADEEFS